MASLARTLYRIPLVLHRWGIRGFERALGIDWIVLTTRGRRTGRPHDVIVDVVGHDPATATWYVQPSSGRTNQWVRNVAVDPLVRAEVGHEAFAARVTDVTGPEGAEVVLRFVRAHPRYARVIVRLVGYVDSIDRPDEELRRALAATPVFAVRRVRGADDTRSARP